MIPVTVCVDGLFAKDAEGNEHLINGVAVLIDGDKERFYDINTSFFDAACPPGTDHKGKVLKDKTITLY